jgi:hypothetical protein
MSYELRLMLAILQARHAGFAHFAAALESELRKERAAAKALSAPPAR